MRTGFLAATGDIIVMMDADGSMSPSEIPHYVHFLANGYDFVKGSRFITGGSSLDITWFRALGNRFLLTVFNSLYRGHLTDLVTDSARSTVAISNTSTCRRPASKSRPR